jgi:hypothetical protein
MEFKPGYWKTISFQEETAVNTVPLAVNVDSELVIFMNVHDLQACISYLDFNKK